MKLRDPGEPPDGPSRTSSDDFPAPLPIPLTPLASLETIPAEDSGITFADSSAKAPPKPAGILFRPPSFQVKRPHGPFEPPSDDDEPGSGGFDESDTSSEASDESSEDEGPLEPTTALGKLGHRLVSFFWRHFSFRMLHWTFFILLLFILTGFICISKGDPETPFVDLLFVVSAAITGSGIIPIPMEALNYYQQAVIFVGMIMGSLTFMSLLPVIMRRRYLLEAINYLEQKHARAAEKHKESLRSLGDPENGNGSAKQRRKSRFDRSTTAPDRLERGVSPTPSKKVRRNTIFQPPGWPYVPSDPDVPLAPIMATRVDSAVAAPGRVIKFAEPKAPALFELDHLSLHGNLVRRRTIASPDVAKEAMASLRKAGRRLSIAHLARHKRLPTAVPELDALNYLIVFVLVYQLLPALFCAFISCMYLINDPDFRTTIQQSSASATPPHLPPVQANPYWFAVFAMFSGFTNAGMMTVSAGASLFLNGGGGPIPYFIVWLTFMGFVLSPLWLRYLTILIRWIEARRLGRTGKEEGLGMRRKTIVGDGGLNAFLNAPEKKSSRLLDALDFLLEHPRRVYTLMFRPAETRWIGFVNIGVTVVGFLIYLVMEWNDPAKLGLTTGRSWDFWFNGFFQESQVRNTGMSIFDLNKLNPGYLVYAICAMYLAVIPIMLARRKSNTYLEQDLMTSRPDDVGAAFKRWIGAVPDDRTRKEREADVYMVSRLKGQLFSDLSFIIVAIFLLVAIECSGELKIPIFNVIFEAVSGFGNVGLSLGYPGTSTSLSAVFTPFGKVIMIIVFMVGRHRGLPDNVDKSVQIPGVGEVVEAADLWNAMEPDARRLSEASGESEQIE